MRRRAWRGRFIGPVRSPKASPSITLHARLGNHVRTYLHREANGTLTELPLAWYAEKGGYRAMNPGYDANRFIAPRKIAYECMFCHNAYPAIPAGHERANSPPVYSDPLPEGIDCGRCHGPGTRHAQLAQSGKASAAEVRGAILNPARLTGDRQMEVCMQCHLQTTSLLLPAAIQRFDRASAGAPKFGIVSSVTRLRASRCFLESYGRLACLTCHDPHNIPRGDTAVAHYDSVCRGCHASLASHVSTLNCAGCHMPKRRTEDVVHAVITDHLIQRSAPPDALAERSEVHESEATAYKGEVIPYYPKPLPAVPNPPFTWRQRGLSTEAI